MSADDVRARAIEAGARAYLVKLTGDDTHIYDRVDDWDRGVAAAVVDAVDPIIRADERNRMTLPEWTQVVADARASAEAEVRERLRAQVEALVDMAPNVGSGNLINRADVLALLDGESNG